VSQSSELVTPGSIYVLFRILRQEIRFDQKDIANVPEETFVLKPRTGPRPRTSRMLPHVQLDQWPAEPIVQELLRRVLALPGVAAKESRIASPAVHAIRILNDDAGGPPQAFIDYHEFCHLHPSPSGSIHLTLPDAVRLRAVEAGWVEPHLIVSQGIISKNVVLVYAPRDIDELETVIALTTISYRFAKGIQIARGDQGTAVRKGF